MPAKTSLLGVTLKKNAYIGLIFLLVFYFKLER